MEKIMETIQPVIDEVFDHLHNNPEVSWQEVQTTAYLKRLLEKEGFEVQEFDDLTGLVATAGTGDGPCVGLRTDIDALWQEVDGVYRANHSCGHDAHMSLIVGTMIALKQLGIPKKGRLKVLFQPAEEKGTGALAFIDKGVVDDIDYLYGVHLRPMEEARTGYATPAILNGAAKMLRGRINGTDAHGARPHQGQNAIEVMALLVQKIHSIHMNPMVPHSAKVTMFQAGGDSANIIPGTGVFSVDMRAQTNEVMDGLHAEVNKAIKSVAAFFGVGIETELIAEIAAAQVDDSAVELMAGAIAETLGAERVLPRSVTPGGEDFHYYTLKRPQIKATMLGLGCDLGPGLHHPKMTFDRSTLITGVEILTRTVISTFEQIESN